MIEKLYANKIILVGVSHVSKKAKRDIETAILSSENPKIALELCERRFYSLFSEKKNISVSSILKQGIFGILISLVEKNIGKELNVMPGEEMKFAANLAKEMGLEIYLIDRDIGETLKRAKKISLREKIRMLSDFVFGYMLGLGEDTINLENIDDILQLLSKFKKRYPGLTEVLLRERDIYMAERIVEISKYGNVVAVVGAAHIKGIKEELNNRFL